jgi:ATP-dependent phosphofructokinase / diphosphate-dependent phosphofructokinase
MPRGNMLIAQSGGPSAVINQSLIGAVLEAKKHRDVGKIFGARHGIQGILGEDFIDLRKESAATLEAVAATPSSALGSVRKKPSADDCKAMFEIMHRYQVRYFFYIGGNDSAETAHIVNEEAVRQKAELNCFHIPKTIDNDLRENDHTPGFGSAAKFVAMALMGIDLDNRALPGVHISVVMGRNAGFLTAAAALARTRPDDGPHLIYLPERPFRTESFVKDVQAVYKKHGRCMIAVSEGIQDGEGTPIVTKFTSEKDSHGNVQLSGTGVLGDLLVAEIKAKTAIKRVRSDTFGYLQRSFPDVVSETDAKEARLAGEAAVRYAVERRIDGSVAIKRKSGARYGVEYVCVPLRSVARETREMPPSFINRKGNDVTEAFLKYARPIVGPLPRTVRFKAVPVKRVGP